jgi:hypothetical protein
MTYILHFSSIVNSGSKVQNAQRSFSIIMLTMKNIFIYYTMYMYIQKRMHETSSNMCVPVSNDINETKSRHQYASQVVIFTTDLEK